VLACMADRRECSRWQIVSRCRERARRVYYGAVVEIKKEIPEHMVSKSVLAPGSTTPAPERSNAMADQQPNPNKPDPNRPDPNKPDPNKPDPNKPDPNKPDPNKRSY
jgi:hypothetical protein